MMGFEKMLPNVMYIVTKGNMDAKDWKQGDLLLRPGFHIMKVYGTKLEVNRGNAGFQIEEFSKPAMGTAEYELHTEHYVNQLAKLDKAYKQKTSVISKILAGHCAKVLLPNTCTLPEPFVCDNRVLCSKTIKQKCGLLYEHN